MGRDFLGIYDLFADALLREEVKMKPPSSAPSCVT
jgi:hypothetical protein